MNRNILIILTIFWICGIVRADVMQDAKVKFDQNQYAEGCLLLKNYYDTNSDEAMSKGDVVGWLGRCYSNGWGVGQDDVTAEKLAEYGAQKHKNDISQNSVGVYAMRKKDFDKAKTFFEASASQGNKFAEINLGELLVKDGQWQDPKRAESLLKRNAEKGESRAQMLLGFYYGKGIFGSIDPAISINWIKKSAEQNNCNAQLILGSYYQEGWGLSKDINAAKKLYIESKNNGCNVEKQLLSIEQLIVSDKEKNERLVKAEESWKKYLAGVLDYIGKVDKKGKETADAAKTKYKSISVKDEMTGVVKTKAIAEGVIGKGTYKVEAFCSGNNLSASVSIFDVEVPTSLKGTVQGRMRIDGKVSPFIFDTDPKWRNIIPVVIGAANNSRLSEMEYYTLNTSGNWVKLILYTSQSFINDDLETSKCEANCPESIIVKRSYGTTLSDVALEIPTSAGNIFIEIPPYDPAIRKVLAACPELSKPEKFGHLKGDRMFKAIYK